MVCGSLWEKLSFLPVAQPLVQKVIFSEIKLLDARLPFEAHRSCGGNYVKFAIYYSKNLKLFEILHEDL